MNARCSFNRVRATLALAAAAAAAVPALPAGAAARLDPAKSTLSAVSTQMGVPVEGRFTKFDAQIDFDPAKPPAGTARLSVDVGTMRPVTSRCAARTGSTRRPGRRRRSYRRRSRRPARTGIA